MGEPGQKDQHTQGHQGEKPTYMRVSVKHGSLIPNFDPRVHVGSLLGAQKSGWPQMGYT